MQGLCPLCGAEARALSRAAGRPILACAVCDLRFVPAAHHVSADQERARYRLHRNTREDAGYVRMLMPAVAAVQRYAAAGPAVRVLDYGCGPGGVLVSLLREAGYDATGYDPFFAADADLSRQFDVVVSTETFEHFRRPGEDIARLVALVKPGGWLVFMTALCDAVADWGQWHYARDSTHVAFYSLRTFAWLARRWGLRLLEHNGRNLVVLVRIGEGVRGAVVQ